MPCGRCHPSCERASRTTASSSARTSRARRRRTASSGSVPKHRVTGEELLSLSEQQTSHIEGMSEPESDVVFAEIISFQYGEANRYTHHWQVHDLLIWDDIALQHA